LLLIFSGFCTVIFHWSFYNILCSSRVPDSLVYHWAVDLLMYNFSLDVFPVPNFLSNRDLSEALNVRYLPGLVKSLCLDCHFTKWLRACSLRFSQWSFIFF